MPQLKTGLDLSGLRRPLQQALRVAADLGADAVEIDARNELRPGQLTETGLRQLRKMLADLNLRVSALQFRTRRGYDTTADIERRIEATKRAMEMAHDLGAGVVVNHIGRIPDESDSAPGELLRQVLDELGQHGNLVGTILAAETGTESGPKMAEFLATLPDGTLGVDFNPGNMTAAGYSAIEAAETLGPWVRHVHATDGVCDLVRRSGEQVTLGRGMADFPAILATLEQHDYRGYFTVQCSGAADPESEFAAALDYLRSL